MVKPGWEKRLKISWLDHAIAQIAGKDKIHRGDIACSETTFKQLLAYELIVPDEGGGYKCLLDRQTYLQAKEGNEPVQASEKQGFLDVFEVTPEDIGKFSAILNKHNPIDYYASAIAPKIREMDHAKKAILIALASHDDKYDDRFRVHVLMYGQKSSGIGKTPLLKWLRKLGAGYIDSTFATRAGVTIDLRDGTPGILARYNGGVCCFDELDKLTDRNSILSALEDGRVPFISGNVEGEYPAEIIGIAGANSIKRFTREQLLRFDFRFEIGPYNQEQACKISDFVSQSIGRPATLVSGEELGKFLKWIRTREAQIPDDVRDPGTKAIKDIIWKSGDTDVRRIYGVWRVARAVARLNFRDVALEDIQTAIELLYNLEVGK